jgi:hypothetical protein
MFKQEGVSAFYKGITPRVARVRAPTGLSSMSAHRLTSSYRSRPGKRSSLPCTVRRVVVSLIYDCSLGAHRKGQEVGRVAQIGGEGRRRVGRSLSAPESTVPPGIRYLQLFSTMRPLSVRTAYAQSCPRPRARSRCGQSYITLRRCDILSQIAC